MNSLILDKINSFIACCQKKFNFLHENSSILKNLDDIEFVLIAILLVLSTFTQTDILGYIATGIIFIYIIKLFIKPNEKIEFSPSDTALLIFFLILIFSTYNSTLPIASFEGFLKYFVYIGYYYSIISVFKRHRKKVLWIVLLIAALGTLESFYALLQSKTVIDGATWQDFSYINPEDAISRIYGSLKHYNQNLLAGYLTACFPFVVGVSVLTIEKRHRKSFFIALAGVLITLFAIFQSGCRGAYLALIAIILAFILFSYRIVFYDFAAFKGFKKLWRNIASVLAGLCVAGLACMPKVINRLMSIFLLRGDSSTSFRMNVYKSAWKMATDNPFFVLGPGNHTFREVYGYYMLTGFDALAAYSVPLEIFVETGIFGFLSFFTFIGLLFTDAIKYICQNQSIRGKIYAAVCIICVFGLMVHGLFDTVFFRPQIQFIFWTAVALLNGVLSRKEMIN